MKKPQKKHLFARTCRVLGRFLLTLGAVLCVASAILAIAPLINPPKTETPTIVEETPITTHPIQPAPTEETHQNSLPYVLPAVIVVTIAIFLLGISFRQYNHTIRKAIARIAKSVNLSISTTELILTTFTWAIVNLIFFFTAPIFAVLTFTAMIINNLLFIFAWTSYGCPVYTI